MSTAPDFDDEDLLPDDLLPTPKGKAMPVKRTAKQIAAAQKRAEENEKARELALAQTAAQAQAARLAQIVNLHIAGYSLAAIGAAIGATEAEVDRLINSETTRYIKNQPALRTFVRNYISERYAALLESVWDKAVDKNDAKQLEYWDRAQKGLAQLGRLHGAEAPTQSEIKVDSAPEAVDALVRKIAAAQGRGYDTDIFDIDEDDIHEVVVSSHEATVVSGNALEARQEGEPEDGFGVRDAGDD